MRMAYSRRELLALGFFCPSWATFLQTAEGTEQRIPPEIRRYALNSVYRREMGWCSRDEAIIVEKPSRNRPPAVVRRSLDAVSMEESLGVTDVIRARADKVYDDTDVSISPDARWALLFINSPHGVKTIIAAIDGSRQIPVDCNEPAYVLWSPDSSAVYCFTKANPFKYDTVSVYDVNSGRRMRSYGISQFGGVSGIFDCFGHTVMPCVGPIIDDKMITISRYDCIFIRFGRQHMGLPVTLATYNLKDTDNPLVQTVVAMPPGSDFIEAVVSPDQSRVIWQIGFETTTDLWISDITGKGMRKLFTTPHNRNSDITDLDPPLASVRWVQDASAVAWLTGQSVYIAALA